MSNFGCGPEETRARGRSEVVTFSQPNASGALEIHFASRIRNSVIVGDEEIAFALLLIRDGSSSGYSTNSQENGSDTQFHHRWDGKAGLNTTLEIVWNRRSNCISTAGRNYELSKGNIFVIILENGGISKVLRSESVLSGVGFSDPKALLDRMVVLFPDERRIGEIKILGVK